jgi:pimeloyl-ACP methyl ester carboxylesterase
VRAREPDQEGYVDRDGVKVAYEVYGHPGVRIVFAPVDTIVHSRAWKAQVPYLARHHQVVTIDPRGNGRSDRPTDPAVMGDLDFVGDTVAVLDELGIARAVLVGICTSAWQSLICAALHPDRVQGVVAVAPWAKDRTPALPDRAESSARFRDELPSYDGWFRFNQNYWRSDWSGFADFFFDQMCCEPHSSKVLEDVLSFANETDADVMLAVASSASYPETVEQAEEMLRSVSCPVLVVEGTEDRCQPRGRFDTVARLTGAERLVLEGSGHLPMARDPIVVNRAIKGFVDRVAGVPAEPRVWSRAARRSPRVLYLSSPIGLGHVRRDLAVARALREERPDVQVEWLTQAPVADFLLREGETLHPASRFLASESAHFESESASTTCTRSRPCAGWMRCWSTTSWSSTTWSRARASTCGWATRPGTSTTSSTRTPSSSGRRSPG